jgi:anti-sigma B factor antagonist
MKIDLHLQRLGASDDASADLSTGQTNHHFIADGRTMHGHDVIAAPSGEAHAIFAHEVFVEQEDEVHTAVVSFRRMNIDVRKSKDVVIVDFKGRLAVGVGDEVLPKIIGELLDGGHKKILLNLSDMDYIDSNGLGELVQSLKTSKRYGASLRLLKPQDRVTKTLRLTNLLPLFSVYESESEALTAFATS